ncbi:TIGR02281 family clan AA aspartic protease [Methyloligella sp. 2.7D]|uniref:retropepsin-like aspartic protease family protein n=1 Tax=unclassified Methyloligella TaxID=2625955 RepID=UPI00157C2AA9|nr:TIGR02281 family clan AA aspartic protease [Methyloligella sp. GL2]QKP77162.1 TIGR02281 family clan AA aspartic protease [Methyloligella sp. GL2]
MSTGTRHLILQSLTWTGAAVAVGVAIYFAEDLGRLVSPSATLTDLWQQEAKAPEPASSGFSNMVRIPRDRSGHYATKAAINGRFIDVMVDTGASLVVLTYEDARRAGLSPQSLDFSGRAQTANGVAAVAPVKLKKIALGGIVLYDVPAAVAERGRLHANLLGMSFLGKLKRFQIENGELVLTR